MTRTPLQSGIDQVEGLIDALLTRPRMHAASLAAAEIELWMLLELRATLRGLTYDSSVQKEWWRLVRERWPADKKTPGALGWNLYVLHRRDDLHDPVDHDAWLKDAQEIAEIIRRRPSLPPQVADTALERPDVSGLRAFAARELDGPVPGTDDDDGTRYDLAKALEMVCNWALYLEGRLDVGEDGGPLSVLEMALDEACNWIDSIERAATGGESCKLCGEVFADKTDMGHECPLPGACDRVKVFRALLSPASPSEGDGVRRSRMHPEMTPEMAVEKAVGIIDAAIHASPHPVHCSLSEHADCDCWKREAKAFVARERIPNLSEGDT